MAFFVEVGALRVGNLTPFVQNSAVIDSTFVSEQTQNSHVPIVLNKIHDIFRTLYIGCILTMANLRYSATNEILSW
jgi:hypothetical protein